MAKKAIRSLNTPWKKSQTLAVRLDQDADQRLDVISELWKCSRGEVIRRLIRQVS